MKFTRTTKLIILIFCTLLQAALSVREITLKNKHVITTFTQEEGKAVTILLKYELKKIQLSTKGEENFILLDNKNDPIRKFSLDKNQINSFKDREFIQHFEQANITGTKVNYEPKSTIMSLTLEEFPKFILPGIGELSFHFETDGNYEKKLYMKYLPYINKISITSDSNIYLFYNKKLSETIISFEFGIFALQTYWGAIGEGIIKDERWVKPSNDKVLKFIQNIKTALCEGKNTIVDNVEVSEEARVLICSSMEKKRKFK
jgi:hypothetical protein